MEINATTSVPGVSMLEKENLGRISQIVGPVLDVAFPRGKMPNIYNALVVKGRDTAGQQINVTCEVQQLLGNNRFRAIAMSATDGLMRGMEVIETGVALSVPVGEPTLGQFFNVLGEPVDNLGPVDTRTTSPIHKSKPAFIQLDRKLSIFEVGIKVVNLLALYHRGGKIRLFGGLRMASAVGYQPTLSTEMGTLEERITSTKEGSITSIQAVYVPVDDLTDPTPATKFERAQGV
ncbi:hypothetical protein PVK06_011922 [Gossypium arboreum]|uniref:H(+)-transporting two-sector ATPase n=1 Tax=Gossypium arboreum TaxID=29729 RepID=A0ABR0QAU0_GOSAR|nr:hypothetical protein PVK06_011922 [Gossypium arboreum]